MMPRDVQVVLVLAAVLVVVHKIMKASVAPILLAYQLRHVWTVMAVIVVDTKAGLAMHTVMTELGAFILIAMNFHVMRLIVTTVRVVVHLIRRRSEDDL
jgi:hypothetical protein